MIANASSRNCCWLGRVADRDWHPVALESGGKSKNVMCQSGRRLGRTCDHAAVVQGGKGKMHGSDGYVNPSWLPFFSK